MARASGKGRRKRKSFGAVAQLGERGLCKPEVVGSIPISSTEKWGPVADHREIDKTRDSEWVPEDQGIRPEAQASLNVDN